MNNRADIIALQNIDCNCNNCIFMERDMAEYDKWRKFHYDMQQQIFGTKKAKAINDAMALVATKPMEPAIKKAYDILLQKAWDMEFMFEKNKINYGNCSKFKKPVSFIPDTCQLDTQICFVNRSTGKQ